MILLTGATGYVGGRLLRALEAEGRPVRCLARRPQQLSPRVGPLTQVIFGDVLDESSLAPAFRGVTEAYYLIHSMGTSGDFEDKDRQAAESFARAAEKAGVRRIVYLGGLGKADDLSPHLESRQEVGRILRESGVPTIELRASIIIGSGSLSFEMIRTLVERLPVMITPRWTRSLAQPIAIEDVIAYLISSLDVDVPGSTIFDIGGADKVSYAGIMREFADARGLRRLVIPVPVLTPGLSSLWLGLVTPLYARVGRKLIDSVRHDTVVTNDAALEAFPVRPRGIREAIDRAAANEDREFAETRWSDALSSGGLEPTYGGVRLGSRIVDSRTRTVACTPADAFTPVRRIGGDTGWYFGDWLWQIRGFLDLLVGGVGMRRGRRDADRLVPGDTVDFWRVEAIEPDRMLRLKAEMKLPGRAWLQFEVEEHGGGSRIRQTAVYDPVGLAGLAYWYLLYPLHELIFRRMLQGIARTAGDPDRRNLCSPQRTSARAGRLTRQGPVHK